jgi:hypothetical protein
VVGHLVSDRWRDRTCRQLELAAKNRQASG